jgi:hypothetical protein
MNTIANILLGIMLLNGAIFTSFLSYQCWEDFCERRAKKQQDAKSQPGGAAK